MSTCFGATCLNMDDLYNFITGIKDLDLYGFYHQKCCGDSGATVDANCECDPNEVMDTSQMCMFDYCWSWTDFLGRLSWARAELATDGKNNNLAFDATAAFMGVIGWFGFKASGDGFFVDRETSFWLKFTQIMMMVVGTISAVWAGKTYVGAAALAGAWGNYSTGTYIGATFLQYHDGINLGSLMAWLTGLWTLVGLVTLASIAAWPLYIAYEMDLAYNPNASDKVMQDMTFLIYGFFIALGGFTSAVATAQGAEPLLTYFDIQSSDQAAFYRQKFVDNNDDDDYKKWVDGLTEDLVTHSIITFAYSVLGLALIEVPGYFVYETMLKYAVKNNS